MLWINMDIRCGDRLLIWFDSIKMSNRNKYFLKEIKEIVKDFNLQKLFDHARKQDYIVHLHVRLMIKFWLCQSPKRGTKKSAVKYNVLWVQEINLCHKSVENTCYQYQVLQVDLP